MVAPLLVSNISIKEVTVNPILVVMMVIYLGDGIITLAPGYVPVIIDIKIMNLTLTGGSCS